MVFTLKGVQQQLATNFVRRLEKSFKSVWLLKELVTPKWTCNYLVQQVQFFYNYKQVRNRCVNIKRSIKHLFHLPSQANKAFLAGRAKTYNQKTKCHHYSLACKEDQGFCHVTLQYSQEAGGAKGYRQRQQRDSGAPHCFGLRSIYLPPRMGMSMSQWVSLAKRWLVTFYRLVWLSTCTSQETN